MKSLPAFVCEFPCKEIRAHGELRYTHIPSWQKGSLWLHCTLGTRRAMLQKASQWRQNLLKLLEIVVPHSSYSSCGPLCSSYKATIYKLAVSFLFRFSHHIFSSANVHLSELWGYLSCFDHVFSFTSVRIWTAEFCLLCCEPMFFQLQIILDEWDFVESCRCISCFGQPIENKNHII